MLSNDPPIKRLERLIEFNLLEKGSFEGFEQEIIEFVSRRAIKNAENKALKGPILFGKAEHRTKYFKCFYDQI